MDSQHAYFSIANLKGTRGAAQIMQQLNTTPGVLSVQVSIRRQQVAVQYDASGIQQPQIRQKLSDMGYQSSTALSF